MKTVIFADQNGTPVILSVSGSDDGPKRISAIAPRLPLACGFDSVDISQTADGVHVTAANSTRNLCDLPCGMDEVEKLWTYLLPVLSQAYVAGTTDARDAFASAISSVFDQN